MCWPEQLIDTALEADPAFMRDFLEHVRSGIHTYSCFSGLGGPENGIALAVQELARLVVLNRHRRIREHGGLRCQAVVSARAGWV